MQSWVLKAAGINTQMITFCNYIVDITGVELQ